jgi:hypothetical protein
MNIYDDLGDAFRIELDCLLFTDVYASLTDDVRAQQGALLGLRRSKLDTQSNKVLNHNQINKHKVMGKL